MKRSTDRILTTHVGSLARTTPILHGMKAKTLNQPYDQEQLARDIADGVKEVVRRQVEAGIDIVNDGEYSRHGFVTYVNDRVGGIESRLRTGEEDVWGAISDREQQVFPEFFEQYHDHYRYLWMPYEVDISDVPNLPGHFERFRVTGPITYTGQASLQQDIDNMKAALEGLEVSDVFFTAVSPMQRRGDADILEIYPTQEAFLYAWADAMKEEYKAIADAGFLLQIDLGALNPRRSALLYAESAPSQEDIDRAFQQAIDVINHGLADIPEERIRYHHCWGSMNTPHTQDAPLREIVHYMLKIKAGAYVLEAANPRHEHEWMVWKDVKLPDGKILVPGMISHATNVVEHPELISWRIQNFASVVGKENVIAGADCGFSQFWDSIRVHPTVQWAKLQSLAEGAALASKALWG